MNSRAHTKARRQPGLIYWSVIVRSTGAFYDGRPPGQNLSAGAARSWLTVVPVKEKTRFGRWRYSFAVD